MRGSMRSAAYRRLGVLACALSALAFAPLRALPQDAQPGDTLGRLVGRVIDSETREGVEGVSLAVAGLSRSVISSSTGDFSLDSVPPGTYELEIRHIAYGTRSTTFEARAGTATRVEIHLEPQAIEVEPLEVQVEFRPQYLERVGFYDRRAEGIGKFFDPAYVDRWSVGTWAAARNLLGEIILDRGSPVNMSDCSAQVLIDGRLDRSGTLFTMSSNEIGAVEVYDGAYGTPDFLLEAGADPFCRTIIIWTRQWLSGEEIERRRIVLCEPSEADDSALVLEGAVTDALTGVRLPRAEVTAWLKGADANGPEWTTTANDDGIFRFCDLPGGQPLAAFPRFMDRGGEIVELVSTAGELVRRDLAVAISRPGNLVGRVTDAAGDPIGALLVTVEGSSDATQTDVARGFAFTGIPPGDYDVTIESPGSPFTADSVSVLSGQTTDLEIALDDETATGGTAVSEVRDLRLEALGFYERRDQGRTQRRGAFITARDIEASGAGRLSEALEDVPGIRLRCSGGGCAVRSARAESCAHMRVYLDGDIVIDDYTSDSSLNVDRVIAPEEIAAIEVYPTGRSLPGQLSDRSSPCGILVLWSR